ncbi:peptide methionine sulfoxide reductase MsrA [Vulcanimicrobium alpinum]|uniref:Peptide methionine sulfoxide reductase MsrA n=1 Tax=Vulcanimicrobium alpinum TaxID=3016050 RepID=A0AAN1XU21_UNVUL|nr:peptide-methionine (S)-S-oxide reductase MsrA [Vulcanimicrobium alpinum]BDE05582.1 peptide methionine sulfoxide reductase MsrA [Vulcanimicrobium alpinum]
MITRFAALLAALSVLAAPVAAVAAPPVHTEKAVLAGGCFWGMEAVFESLRGVTSVVSGFSGGNAMTAHYEIVSTGMTGHAESVEITYDPAQISYAQLLDVYFAVAHDPTELNRQGPDDGPQYRSSIFYTSDEQRRVAEQTIKKLTDEKTFRAPIVTKVVKFTAFYPAESYHQHFAERNPDNGYIVFNDKPKLEALRKRYPQLLKANAVALRLTKS